ncbi:MAG: aminomethyl-transferring glycine dehydrogenase subunit GcvPA [Syntrophotaleaceae bacterium]
MRYLPHTEDEIRAMLEVIGVKSLDDLFRGIPEDYRLQGDLPLPPALDEWQLDRHFRQLADAMAVNQNVQVLIGAGSYHHHIPETVRALAGRGEFLTAYTPYQPEISQGTLQGIFEYQTLTARLLGLDVANASLYDGASALAEALLMGLRITGKKRKVAVSRAIHPHYRQVAKTYLQATEFELVELPFLENGCTDLSALKGEDDLAAVALQSPNFFGVLEDLEGAGDLIHEAGALLIACFTEPLAFGLFKSPGRCGADIACGEGQSFGLPRSFGGAGLGMLACQDKFTRSLPGRLVGETVDVNGRRGFVLTLATREQHIRREKATSNICTNQGLCALTAAMYLASLGGSGLRELARLNYDKSEYLKSELQQVGGKLTFAAPTFNEFVMDFTGDFHPIRQRLMDRKIVAGLELDRFYPELTGHYLFCVTETADKDVLDTVVREVKG